MQPASMQNLNSGPFLGYSGIEQETIDQAVDFLIQSLSLSYFKLLKQIFEDIRTETDQRFYKAKLESSKGLLGGDLEIPEYLIMAMKNQKSKEVASLDNSRYFAQLCYEVKDLEPNTSINHLLILLSRKIKNLGFPSKHVVVRFEKGCFESRVQIWHRDTSAFDQHVHAISTSYSTISHWNTRILDEEGTKEIFGDLSRIPSGILNDNDSVMIEKVESLSTSAQLGFLYNVTEILHRAPRTTDVSPDLININDYRLFIRFSSE